MDRSSWLELVFEYDLFAVAAAADVAKLCICFEGLGTPVAVLRYSKGW
jgi:hypothetical protein